MSTADLLLVLARTTLALWIVVLAVIGPEVARAFTRRAQPCDPLWAMLWICSSCSAARRVTASARSSAPIGSPRR